MPKPKPSFRHPTRDLQLPQKLLASARADGFDSSSFADLRRWAGQQGNPNYRAMIEQTEKRDG